MNPAEPTHSFPDVAFHLAHSREALRRSIWRLQKAKEKIDRALKDLENDKAALEATQQTLLVLDDRLRNSRLIMALSVPEQPTVPSLNNGRKPSSPEVAASLDGAAV